MKFANTTAQTPHQASARESAIVQNLDIVNSLARRLRRRVPPCVTLDDLTSAGTIGLIKAVDRFDGSRGLKFRSYAQHRVMGAMLDFLREEDPLSRAERRRVRESAPVSNLPATISLDQLPAPVVNRLVAIEDRAAYALLVRAEIRNIRQCLSVRENRVIALLFESGWQNRQVAADLKVNESRVSQIKQRAISKLRAAIQGETTVSAA
jgi:RNA polymerase sigma factor for flagellar operon FliA